jgi:hypothetical protein
VVGSCEHSNELLSSIKGGDFLTSAVTISFLRTLFHRISYTVKSVTRLTCVSFPVDESIFMKI